MKKRGLLLLGVISMLVLWGTGCSSKGKLSLEEGVLSWEKVSGAIHYEVQLNETSLESAETKINLSEVCEYEGEYNVTVFSVLGTNKKKEIGSLEIETRYVKEPEIIITDTDGQKNFVWESDKNASGYQYDLFDGFGKRMAKSEENGSYKVEFDGGKAAMISVTAKGNSEGNVVFLNREANYQYDGTEIFSLAELVKYPFYYTSAQTANGETFTVGTTLKKGNHDVELCFYVMDSRGMTLSGNGTWGRRFVDAKGEHYWFCATELEEWPGSGGTIPIANQLVKKTVNANVNKYGEIIMPIYNFKQGEMLVVADVIKNGKSVIADAPAIHDAKDSVVFDTSKLEDYVAVYTGKGNTGKDEDREFFIPVDLEDGTYRVELSYQLMTASGAGVTGNGAWGRRISDATMSELVWWCEYDLPPHTTGIDDMPSPEETLKSELSVEVQNGKCKILCLSFAKGEMMAVSGVKKISGSSAKFDVSTLKNYSNVFVSTGEGEERFRVNTTLFERGRFDLEITYYAMNSAGRMLSGNGKWGRRMVDERDELWICATAPSAEHSDAANTIPEPNQPVSKTVTVSVNKKGRFFLDMYNFVEGETIVITDIKYQGESVILN